jgi:CRP-like cAMP-binding protein
METQDFSEFFSLFNNLNPETLEWLGSVIEEEDYGQDEVIIAEDSWGKAVYFIVSGWVKVQNRYPHKQLTVEIIGRGGFVGEIGILNQITLPSAVVALSPVKVVSISAQRFIQTLFRDPPIQHRLLRLIVSRLLECQKHHQLYRQPAKVKMVTVLISLADKYGEITEAGTEIYLMPLEDLADLAQLQLKECSDIMSKLENKDLIRIDPQHHSLCLTNLKQLNHIIGKLGND